jgi:hypothetical protein
MGSGRFAEERAGDGCARGCLPLGTVLSSSWLVELGAPVGLGAFSTENALRCNIDTQIHNIYIQREGKNSCYAYLYLFLHMYLIM